MQLKDIKPAKGSTHARKRLGRGNSSGTGTTAGRGTKGQLSRSGGGKGDAFEGGQNPLHQRLPKLPGFKNINRKAYRPLNVARLEAAFNAGDTVNAETLLEKGLTKSLSTPVKILGDGTISKKLTVAVEKVSASAKEKIETAGGTVEETGNVKPAKKAGKKAAAKPAEKAAESKPAEK